MQHTATKEGDGKRATAQPRKAHDRKPHHELLNYRDKIGQSRRMLADGDAPTSLIIKQACALTGRKPSCIRARLNRLVKRGKIQPRLELMLTGGRPQHVWPMQETLDALLVRERVLDLIG
jgi:hypothetical protein